MILKIAQKDVFFQIRRLHLESLISPVDLTVDIIDMGRQQSPEAEIVPLLFGKGRSFVIERVSKKLHASKLNLFQHFRSIYALCHLALNLP